MTAQQPQTDSHSAAIGTIKVSEKWRSGNDLADRPPEYQPGVQVRIKGRPKLTAADSEILQSPRR